MNNECKISLYEHLQKCFATSIYFEELKNEKCLYQMPMLDDHFKELIKKYLLKKV